jgi:hypothetical protein
MSECIKCDLQGHLHILIIVIAVALAITALAFILFPKSASVLFIVQVVVLILMVIIKVSSTWQFNFLLLLVLLYFMNSRYSTLITVIIYLVFTFEYQEYANRSHEEFLLLHTEFEHFDSFGILARMGSQHYCSIAALVIH